MPDRSFTAKITRLERARNSVNGNPRYRFHFEQTPDLVRRPLLSKRDVGTAYEWTGQLEGRTVTVHVDSQPQVIDITPAP